MNFTDELTAFRDRTVDPGYDALILLGTRQSTTAALLIGTLQLQRVAFLLTEETRGLPDEVAVLLSCSPETWFCPPGDHSTTLAVYQGLRQVLDQWVDLDRSRIAVDVTGGLKPMSLGLEKAAHVLGLQTIYVQSDYTTQANGRFVTVPGTQRLIIPPDPYLVFGDLEAAEARRQFRQHNYAVAARLFEELANRVPEPQCRHYAAAAALAAAYAAWDVFDFADAQQHLDALLTLPPSDLGEIAAYRSVLKHQHTALGRLYTIAQSVVQHDDDALRTLADPDAILPLLGTLHATAERRAAQGRYDFAALFCYRCLELISQHRLASHGLLSHKPDYKRLPFPKADLSTRFQAVQRQLGRKQPKGLPDRVMLFDGYMLLAALDDPLVRGYSIKQIEDRSQARNTSVLAHGYRLIDQPEYDSFAGVVEAMIDRLFGEVLHHPRAEWESQMRFQSPFAM